MPFTKKGLGDWYGAIIRNALFIELARFIAETREVSQDDLQAADKMKNLAGVFGLNIPYKMTLTQLKNMMYCGPALITLAVQVQNVLRFYIDADECWRDLTKIKLPPKWDRNTVTAAHSILEENAKKYHLGRNNIPQGKYFCVNDMNMDVFRAQALKMRVKNCAFFPSIDSLYQTAIPRRASQVGDIKSFLGGKVPCLKLADRGISRYLAQTNICVAF